MSCSDHSTCCYAASSLLVSREVFVLTAGLRLGATEPCPALAMGPSGAMHTFRTGITPPSAGLLCARASHDQVCHSSLLCMQSAGGLVLATCCSIGGPWAQMGLASRCLMTCTCNCRRKEACMPGPMVACVLLHTGSFLLPCQHVKWSHLRAGLPGTKGHHALPETSHLLMAASVVQLGRQGAHCNCHCL